MSGNMDNIDERTTSDSFADVFSDSDDLAADYEDPEDIEATHDRNVYCEVRDHGNSSLFMYHSPLYHDFCCL